MTGAYVRIERNNKWQSIEIEYLTNKERKAFFKDKTSAEILKWLDLMCEWVARIRPLYGEDDENLR